MAEFSTYEEMGKEVAERALDEFLYMGKSLREWIHFIVSEDCVSRQAGLDAISRIGLFKSDTKEVQVVAECLRAVEVLPPAIPKQKTGKWIHHSIVEGFKYERTPYECSCCNKFERESSNFCPNCGSKMEVEE